MDYVKKIEKIEGLIVTLMQQMKIPGLSISVVNDEKIVYTKGFGARLLTENIPATSETLFGVGSVSKSFTALAIMQLVQEGKLDLNDPVSKYVPFKLGRKEKPILIKHLLSHSSGIPDLEAAVVLIARHSWNKLEKYVPMSGPNDFYLYVNQGVDEVVANPGEKYFYLNTGFILLGHIIEKISGLKFDAYIKEKIFNPLEMLRTTFRKEEFEKEEDRMTAYISEPEKPLEMTIHPFDELIYAAGGILSSVNELGNYLIMNINEGKFNNKQIIKPELYRKLIAPSIDVADQFFGKFRYGFGWGITENFFGETLIEHGGSTGVSSAHLAFLPSKRLGVAIAGNMGSVPGSIITQAILMLLMDKKPQIDHPILRLDAKLGQFVGEYQSFKGITKIEIIKRGLTLYIKEPENDFPTAPLIPESDQATDYRFYIPMGQLKTPAEFTIDKDTGKIDFYPGRNVYHKVGNIKK
ncbi:MAG TPA: serine hydrolase [Candidatus Bathyarchaeia archaeon]|nr:serine hydrolase [Candidatus Bathyarchaeia archaeon]